MAWRGGPSARLSPPLLHLLLLSAAAALAGAGTASALSPRTGGPLHGRFQAAGLTRGDASAAPSRRRLHDESDYAVVADYSEQAADYAAEREAQGKPPGSGPTDDTPGQADGAKDDNATAGAPTSADNAAGEAEGREPTGSPEGGNAPPSGGEPPSEEDTPQSTYELQASLSNVVAVHMVHIPGTNKYLYMERPSGWHPDGSHVIAGTYDMWTDTFENLDSPDGLFCAGHTIMHNGSVLIVGGHIENAGYPSGIQSIRTFTDGEPALYKVTDMRWRRWYPTVTLMPNKQYVIMGGTQGVGAGTKPNAFYEVWDPLEPLHTRQLLVSPIYLSAVKQNYYPFNYVLPTGDMFNYCGRVGYIIDALSGTYKQMVPHRPLSVVSPSSVYTTQFPYTGTSVMLALRPEEMYDVDILIIGGADIDAARNLELAACSESIRLGIQMPRPWKKDQETYWFKGGWVTEQLAYPRVMPDATILPNGVVILLNGAMYGLAGDAAGGGQARSTHPAFYAEMYDPHKKEGSRWTTLGRSGIPRLYHSTAALTMQGTILVSGCDRCGKIVTNDTEMTPAPVKAEYRNEIFYPPFWFDVETRPVLMDWPNKVTYGQKFAVMFAGEVDPDVPITGAALVAPSSTTHSFNQNQRVIMLEMEPSTEQYWATLVAPPNANIAPPQLYMLFLLNGYTYSSAQWIMLDDE